MYVFDQTGAVDSAKLIEYITKDFPGEFKQLIEARDELAKRQGALTAADDALKMKAQAEATLASAKADAASLIADAKAKQDDAKAKAAAVKAREDAVTAAEKDLAQRQEQFDADVAVTQTKNAAERAALNDGFAALQADRAKLDDDRAALDTRIKNFQAKVAALSA